MYIVAGRYSEAVDYAHKNNLKVNNWRYVFDYTAMLGTTINGNDFEIVGTWQENDNAINALEFLLNHYSWRHVVKDKLRRERDNLHAGRASSLWDYMGS